MLCMQPYSAWKLMLLVLTAASHASHYYSSLEHVVNLQVPSILCCLLVLANGFLRGLFILNLCLRDMIKIAIT